jgi:hypothetical protein
VVVSHTGNVEVRAYNHGYSGITAEAQGAHLNTASVGVAAGADLSPSDVIPEELPMVDVLMVLDGYEPYYTTGNVVVQAYCDSEAEILAWAHDADPMYEPIPEEPLPDTVTAQSVEYLPILGESTAKTVICAPGEVDVVADESSEARIKSLAGWYGEDEAINKATTKVYASDVYVDTQGTYRGQGIWAMAFSENSDNPHVAGEMMLDYLGEPYNGDYYCMTEHGEIAWTDGDAVLYIQDYSKRTDCPTCPPCPCEEAVVFAPVAPLWVLDIPRIEGCPAVMLAAAAELGITAETLQVGIGNALALNPSIQPCGACSDLVNNADILRDVDGSGMAAVAEVFNSLAPANVPFSPEMGAMIAASFAEHADDTTMPQYAKAKAYIDAFVNYVAALDQLGSPVGDSTEFVMAKYGDEIKASDNPNVLAYLELQLAGGI